MTKALRKKGVIHTDGSLFHYAQEIITQPLQGLRPPLPPQAALRATP